MIEGDMATAPYLRHKEHQHVYDDHHSAEYDADDEDVAWLDKINSKVRAAPACCSHSSNTGSSVSQLAAPLVLLSLTACGVALAGRMDGLVLHAVLGFQCADIQ